MTSAWTSAARAWELNIASPAHAAATSKEGILKYCGALFISISNSLRPPTEKFNHQRPVPL